MSGTHIRPYRLEDAPFVYDAVRESLGALQPWLPWAHADYSIEETRAWLAVQVHAFERRSEFAFAITTGADDYLGGCGVNRIDPENQRANLGYWVRSSAAGHGVATTALLLARDWGFAHTDLVRLEVLVAIGNLASRRVAEKAGAVYEGTLRRRIVLHGVTHDAALYSFVR